MDSKVYKKYKISERFKGISMSYDEKKCKQVNTSKLSQNFIDKFNNNIKQETLKIQLAYSLIDLFISKGLLNKIGNNYFLLNTNKRFTWNNIKQLKEKHIDLDDDVIQEIYDIFNDDIKYDLLVLVKCLFWFFRKAVVDSFLSDIINNSKKIYKNAVIYAISVGSMKLTSDYDISLDTEYEISAMIIQKYNKIIETVFRDVSSEIFDTKFNLHSPWDIGVRLNLVKGLLVPKKYLVAEILQIVGVLVLAAI
jgi:hypothetical protein